MQNSLQNLLKENLIARLAQSDMKQFQAVYPVLQDRGDLKHNKHSQFYNAWRSVFSRTYLHST